MRKFRIRCERVKYRSYIFIGIFLSISGTFAGRLRQADRLLHKAPCPETYLPQKGTYNQLVGGKVTAPQKGTYIPIG